jgi:hypothetical protein
MKKKRYMPPDVREVWLASRTKHGAYNGGGETPEHYVWRTMLARCNNPNANSYAYYGGRGIHVCKAWHMYENFVADMGLRPSSEHSLERINVDKGYIPSNCKWATRSEQQRNKRNTRFYTNGSFSGTLVECAVYVGISKELAYWRWKTWGTFLKGTIWQELQRGP